MQFFDNFLQNISPDLTIDLTCYPYYTQMYCNARVLNRAKSLNEYYNENPYIWKDSKVIEQSKEPLNPYNFNNLMIIDNICSNCQIEEDKGFATVFSSDKLYEQT